MRLYGTTRRPRESFGYFPQLRYECLTREGRRARVSRLAPPEHGVENSPAQPARGALRERYGMEVAALSAARVRSMCDEPTIQSPGRRPIRERPGRSRSRLTGR